MKNFKRVLFAAFLMLASVDVFSGNLSINGGVVYGKPGEKGNIDIYLNNTDSKIEVVQFELVVPKGVTLSTTTEIDPETDEEVTTANYKVYRNLTNGVLTYGYDSEKQTYTFLVEPASGKYVSATEGVLISFELNYSSSFEGGDAKLANIVIAGENTDYPDDVAFKFEVGNPSVTIKLENSWNTYCSHENLDFTDLDVKAYVVTDVTATSAKLEEVTKIPANTGFLIKGTANSEIKAPIIKSADAISTNKLTGVIRSTKFNSEGNYILSGDKFIPATKGTIPANKAYLKGDVVPPSSAKVFTFDFGESTGINEVQKSETESAIYNLSGMRVSKTQKGVYIMNGRKVIVK